MSATNMNVNAFTATKGGIKEGRRKLRSGKINGIGIITGPGQKSWE